jgi:Fic family protein
MSTDIDTLRERYPHIRFARHWDADDPDLRYMLGECSALVEAISQAPLLPRFRDELHRVSLRKGAQATTAIEGNTLSDEEVERIATGHSLPESQAYQQREVQNVISSLHAILEGTVVDDKQDLISPGLLLRFHRMVGTGLGEHFGSIPGRFASSQRIVGPYRAPAPDDVPALVDALCAWLRDEFRFGVAPQRFSDAIVQAIVTHVYIEWIHPFDDGNGRTGRLVEFYILLRAGLPTIASHLLANHYNDTRAEYYRQLQRSKQPEGLTSFLRYAITGFRDGLRKALEGVQENAMEQMWRVLVHEKFGKRPVGRNVAFKRRREVALALPLDRPIAWKEVFPTGSKLARAGAVTAVHSNRLTTHRLRTGGHP